MYNIVKQSNLLQYPVGETAAALEDLLLDVTTIIRPAEIGILSVLKLLNTARRK